MQNACMAVAMCDVNAARILLSQKPDKQPWKYPQFSSKNAEFQTLN